MQKYTKNRIKSFILALLGATILGLSSSIPVNANTLLNIPIRMVASGNIPVPSYQFFSQPIGISLLAGELAEFASNIALSKWLGPADGSLRPQISQQEKRQRPVKANFFGSVPIAFSAEATRRKWNQVRAALDAYREIACRNSGGCSARLAMIDRLVNQDRTSPLINKLETVNATVNAMVHYRPDGSLNGKIDNWADPGDTIRAGTGDCEDYAILKLAALKDLGVPMNSMSIVILRDTRRNLYHAVLAVTTNRGHLILDNMRNRVFRDTAFADYKPLYSFSGGNSWIHGTKVDPVLASADDGAPLGAEPIPANVDRSIKTASVGNGALGDLVPVPVE